MNEDDIRALIRDEFKKLNTSSDGFSSLSSHTHAGVDSQKLNPDQALLGFPVRTVAPTEQNINGKLVLFDDGATRRIYVKIGATWYSTIVA